MSLFPFFALTLLAFYSKQDAFAASPINEVLANVGSHAVTSRELKMNIQMERLLYPASAKEKTDLPNLDSKEGAIELSRVLTEWTVFLEAQTFKVAAPSEVEIKASEKAFLRALAERKSDERAWEKLEVTNRELSEMVDRKVRAKKFITFKSKASVVPVTDAEALRYYQKWKDKKFGGRPFNQFRETIKQYLSQTQAEERIRDWFVVLQKKYAVRRVEDSPKGRTDDLQKKRSDEDQKPKVNEKSKAKLELAPLNPAKEE